MNQETINQIETEILLNKEKIFNNFDKGSLDSYEFIMKRFEEKNGKIKNDEEFRRKFKLFYRLSPAHLGIKFEDKYFELLESGENDLEKVLRELYKIETLRKRKTIQFSFATKLLHTLDSSKPIFDSKVKDRLNIVMNGDNGEEKIYSSIKAYNDLQQKINQLSGREEVKKLIEEFKIKFHPSNSVSDIKILDFILWSW